MSTINREQIFQEVTGFIDRSVGSTYNLSDMLLTPLYLDAVQRMQVSTTWKEQLVRFAYKVSRFFRYGSIPNKNFDVILWPAEYSHINQMSVVQLRLKESGVRCIWIANKKKIARRLEKLQQDFFYIPDPYSVDVLFMRRLWKKHISIVGRHVFNDTIRRQLPVLAGFIQLANKLVTNVKPVGLLVGNDLTLEGRVATDVFKRLGIYTACIQHGTMSDLIHSKHSVDDFFVYGKRTLESLPLGNTGTRFLITGAPYLEHFGGQAAKNSVPNSKLVHTDQPYILVALSGPGNNTSFDHHQQLVDAIFKLADQVKTCSIVIKLHPKDRLAHYAEVQKKYPPHHVTLATHDSDYSIFDWLSGCELLITGASATALEAMHLGIPVISVDLMDEYSHVPFIKDRATHHARTYDALLHAVQVLKETGEKRSERILIGAEYAEDYFFTGKRKSSELIAATIMDAITISGDKGDAHNVLNS